MERQFCYLCASRLEQKNATSWWCPQCEYTQYENAKPCVELVLYKNGKILIAQRGIEPRKGAFDMPGGFVELKETFEQALLREAKEELDLNPEDISTPVYLWSFNNSYPFGPEIYRTVVTVFCAEFLAVKELEPHDDVASFRWISPHEVDSINWALPFHKENIQRLSAYLK